LTFIGAFILDLSKMHLYKAIFEPNNILKAMCFVLLFFGCAFAEIPTAQ
jgi:hypothetical protein